jgi:dipeptidyl aminopeptidase/acylaminoacyl peptidase
MRRLTTVLTAAAALACSAPAPAASIYYSCGDAICRIAPDGSGGRTVASGRTYRSPSVSLDGGRLAWIEPAADLFTGDGSAGNAVGPITRFAVYAVISPDGSQVLTFEGAGQPTRVCVYAADGSGPCDGQAGGSVTSAGWAPGNRVMITTRDSGDPAFTAHDRNYNNSICLLKPSGGATGGECEQTYAYDADSELDDPALSPDGTTLAVSRAPWDHQDQGQIALFDVATGALERVLTSGPGDETPFWSPDGSQIAFARDGGIYVVSAAGAEGSERRIADGNSPTWANVGAAAVPKVTTARTQHGSTVRGKVAVATAGSKLVVELLVESGKSYLLVGKSTRKSVPAGTQAWSASLTKKVRRALKGIHKVPLVVRVSLTAPGGTPVRVLRKVTLLR